MYYCWLNGSRLLANQFRLPAANAGNLLGWGVFTTIGVRDARPLFLSRHLARLRGDAQRVGIPLDFTDASLQSAIQLLIAGNKLQGGVVRITLTRRGDGRWHSEPGSHCLILAHPWLAPKMDELSVCVSPFRFAARRPLAGIKSTSQLEYQLAWQAAHDAGCDEALLLNDAEQLCEAARANVFWVSGGILHTPSLTSGCLPGVARGVLLEAACELKITVAEIESTVEELSNAEEFFLTSATSGPRSVDLLKTGDSEINFASPGPVMQRLRDWWLSHE